MKSPVGLFAVPRSALKSAPVVEGENLEVSTPLGTIDIRLSVRSKQLTIISFSRLEEVSTSVALRENVFSANSTLPQGPDALFSLAFSNSASGSSRTQGVPCSLENSRDCKATVIPAAWTRSNECGSSRRFKFLRQAPEMRAMELTEMDSGRNSSNQLDLWKCTSLQMLMLSAFFRAKTWTSTPFRERASAK